MKYFSKNKKWMAYLILLTFLFTSIMPINLATGDSAAYAAYPLSQKHYDEDAKVWYVESDGQGHARSERHIDSVKLGNQTIPFDADGKLKGSNGVSLSNIYPNAIKQPLNSNKDTSENKTLVIMPQKGYYVTRITIACAASPHFDADVFECLTWGANQAYEQSFEMSTTGVTLEINSACFGHESSSNRMFEFVNYGIVIETAQIPDPVYVHYNPGSIEQVVEANNAIANNTIFDSDGSHSDISVEEWMPSVELETNDNTLYKYPTKNNNGSFYPSHEVQSITDEALKIAREARYEFAGWKLQYYKGINFDRNSRYSSMENGVGASITVSSGSTVELMTHAELVAQWEKIQTVDLTVNKVWDDADNQDVKRPESLKVTLSNGTEVTLNAENGWTATVTGLPKYAKGQEIKYSWTESELPEGYELESNKTEGKVTTITNKHVPETIDISGRKIWDDNNNQDGLRPEKIVVRLYADGKEVRHQEVTAGAGIVAAIVSLLTDSENTWDYTFKGLPKYANGTEIVYTVAEEAVTGYKAEVNGYDISNTHTPEETEATVKKVWNDANNQDGKRPTELKVTLSNGTETVKTVTLNAANSWTATVTGLPKYAKGEVIEYTWTESSVDAKDYKVTDTSVNGKVTTLTNSYIPETIEVAGGKTWNDNNNQDGVRPASITVNLLADGTEIDKATVTAENGWAWSFDNLPKYKDGGTEIDYTITENDVDFYTVEVNGYNITNTHITATTSISGTKTWDDNNNKLGKRPESITVNLLQNGKEIKEVTVTAADNWTYSFEEQPKVNTETGEAYVYTVTEDAVPEYRSIITKTASGYDITNTLITGEAGQIQVTKVVTGDGAPVDGVFGFKLHIEASAPDWDAIDVYNKLQLEKAYEAAVEAYEAAKEAWNKAVAQFASGARELRTTGSAVQFVMKGESTTPSGYQYLMIDDAARIASTTSSSYFMDLDAGAADTGEGSIFAQVVDAIYNLAEDFSKANSVFLKALGEAVTTTPSALGFEQDDAQNLLNEADRLFEAKALMDSTSSSVLEFENSPEVTTPSAVTLIIRDAAGSEIDRQEMFNEQGEYEYLFDLRNGQTYSFEILATTGSMINYWISEIQWVTENYEGTTVTMNGTDVTSSGVRYSGEHQLTTDSVYDFVFNNKYSDESGGGGYNPWTPEPPKKPDPPKPPEIVIDDPEVPLDEPEEPVIVPGEEIPEPEIPLGDAPATGDAANAVPFMALMLFALCGLVVTRRKFN